MTASQEPENLAGFFAALARFAQPRRRKKKKASKPRFQNESAEGGKAETLGGASLAPVQKDSAGSQEGSQHRLTCSREAF